MKHPYLLVLASTLAGLASSPAEDAPHPVKWPEAAIVSFAPAPAPVKGSIAVATMEAKAPSLDEASNTKLLLKQIGLDLSEAQKAFLKENRFVLVPVTSTRLQIDFAQDEENKNATPDEMLHAFVGIGGSADMRERHAGNARLITPDLFLHAFHRFFSHALEHIEAVQLRPRLERMLWACVENSAALREGASEAAAKRLSHVEAQFAAAWILLGNDGKDPAPPTPPEGIEPPADPDDEPLPDDPAIRAALEQDRPSTDKRNLARRLEFVRTRLPGTEAAAVAAEIDLILKAAGMGVSPVFGYAPDQRQDYTQFRPRSHYTKNWKLRGYFRAMMFLGRNGYPLTEATNPGLPDALLATTALCRPGADGKPPLDRWRDLMEITSFFAGQSDDITYPELRAWVAETTGKQALAPNDALDPKVIEALAAAGSRLRPPQINSVVSVMAPAPEPTAEFRLFGQRFTWDGWIFNELVDTRGTGAKPSIISATSVMAAFGDPAATEAARAFVAREFPGNTAMLDGFGATLGTMRPKLEALPDAEWFRSLSAKQLHVLTRLAGGRGKTVPHYMRSPFFGRRQLSSMMGSFTELKHDTVLYAKQVYAELGEGGEGDKTIPAAPRSFVQPDLSFWLEMERLARFAADGFARHKLLPDADEEFGVLGSFATHVAGCRKIVEKELAATPLSKGDWEFLWSLNLMEMDSPLDPGQEPDPQRGKTAVVTDVMTDAISGRILTLGTGRPLIMLALVGTEKKTRLVAGPVYDAFESAIPLDKRPTDEEWRQPLYGPKPVVPARPAWAAPVPEAKAPVKASEGEG